MSTFHKILVPVDLSRESQPAIALASQLAQQHNAELVFCFVSFPPLPEEAMYSQTEMDSIVQEEKAVFEKITPLAGDIRYRHVFLQGNPGPVVANFAREHGFDLIVLATHGRKGFVRWLLGSVTEYVIRHSEVPVLTVKTAEPPRRSEADEAEKAEATLQENVDDDTTFHDQFTKKPLFVTTVMVHAPVISERDQMQQVIAELGESESSAAPVIDSLNKCIGILTESDVWKYLELAARFENQDESVLDEVYATNAYGMRSTCSDDFHQVKRHMSAPVVSVSTSTSCAEAEKVFAENSQIHHLVVVDEKQIPVGIITPSRLERKREWNAQSAKPGVANDASN